MARPVSVGKIAFAQSAHADDLAMRFCPPYARLSRTSTGGPDLIV